MKFLNKLENLDSIFIGFAMGQLVAASVSISPIYVIGAISTLILLILRLNRNGKRK